MNISELAAMYLPGGLKAAAICALCSLVVYILLASSSVLTKNKVYAVTGAYVLFAPLFMLQVFLIPPVWAVIFAVSSLAVCFKYRPKQASGENGSR